MIVRGIDRFGVALVLLAGLILATDSHAETYVYTGAWSDHIASKTDYNETHNLVAVEYKSTIAGYFENSFGDDSFFAGSTYSRQWGDFEAGLMVGAMYGYKGCKGQQSEPKKTVCPMVAPTVSYTKYQAEPSFIILGNAVALSVRWEL